MRSLAILLFAATILDAQTPAVAKRPLRVSDLYKLRNVNDPQLSPDGSWVAYTVSSIDSSADKTDTDVWMTSWDGAQTIRLTWTPESESSPRWSPDGRYLAFVSGRQEGRGGQIWLLDRRGGEAQRITQIKGGVDDYAWSPDSKRIAVILDEETDSIARRDSIEHKTPKPIVINRYQFKRDIYGYLGTERSHLSIFNLDTKKVDSVTGGEVYDDGDPAWSPDGKWIAFVRTPTNDPAQLENSDVWVVEARAGAVAKQLTTFSGADDGRLSWSPDGKSIAFLRGDEPKFSAYSLSKLSLVASDGSAPARVVTASFDRPIFQLRFSSDGAWVYGLASDDRAGPLLRVRVADGTVERIITGKRVVAAYSMTTDGRTALLMSTPDRPAEVFAWERNTLRQLSHQNDSLLTGIRLGTTEDFASRSADGTEVHGLLVRPAGTPAGTRLPMILYIHGGPNGQDQYAFSFDRELFAANGYAVLAVNYRGSNGRGSAYQRAIFGDWGNLEVVDLLGAVDEAVRSGVADSTRLGIGGWSYGGILTDYSIASTTRFKAAISGAGSALQLSMYGHDQYIPQYDLELGYPWKSQDTWLKVSYPFFHADRIKTPTLFLGGASDFNVPIIGGEQMYQALRTLGVATELVIYPSQFHGITIPSYRIDRYQRYVAWYDRFLKGQTLQAGGMTP